MITENNKEKQERRRDDRRQVADRREGARFGDALGRRTGVERRLDGCVEPRVYS